MLAMKFGGTSVGAPDRMLNVAHIVKLFLDKNPIVVISAMGGVTDALLYIAEDFLNRRKQEGEARLIDIRKRHFEVINTLIKSPYRRKKLEEEISDLFSQLEEIVHGVYLLRELSEKSLALISSFGERLSVPILTQVLNEIGVDSAAFDSRKYVVTDDNFLSASVNMDETFSRIKREILPHLARGITPVITGFIGATGSGLTTTLGRGGSDYSGALFGAACDSDEIWIWTDVSGVFSADPRIVKNARVLNDVSYQEAAEMSYFGAKVIHPKTMIPAVHKNIPIRIKNTFVPDDPGTLISHNKKSFHPVRMVTAIKKVNLVSIQGSGMIGIPHLNSRIFTVADRVRTDILMFSQASSGYNMSLVISELDSERSFDALQTEFRSELESEALDGIYLNKNVAIVSIVGSGMRGTPGISGTLFSTLGSNHINIIAIAQGSSELNISFVVDEMDADRCVSLLHGAFIFSKIE